MKFTKLFAFLFAVAAFAACGVPANTNINTNGNMNVSNVNTSTAASVAQTLTEVPRPQKITDMTAQRGEQDQAAPALKIASPADGSVLRSSGRLRWWPLPQNRMARFAEDNVV